MGRRAKPAKAKVEAKPSVTPESGKDDLRVRDLEKRLAEALKREAEAQEQLQTRDRELVEAQEQQTATAEILRVISSSPTDVQPVFDSIAKNGTTLCDAAWGAVIRFDGQLLTLMAQHNMTPSELELLSRTYPRTPTRGRATGRAIIDGRTVHVPDIREDPDYLSPFQQALGFRTVLAVPMLRDGEPIGVLALWRREVRPFTDQQIALMETFADQAVIAIENVRLFTETKEALEQQTATSEILRVISSSPTDVQPVFDAIVQSGQRLLNGHSTNVLRVVGNELQFAAMTAVSEAADAEARATFPVPLTAAGVATHVIRTRRSYIVADIETDPLVTARLRHTALLRGFRSMLMVPMVHHEQVIGVITVTGRSPGAFSEDEVALLQTFADQAVIAIENVRLFNETKESLERQTATAEILRVISESPTDYQPVFDTIVRNAARLCAAHDTVLALADGEDLVIYAQHGPIGAPIGVRYPMRDTASGLAVKEARRVHVENLAEANEFPAGRDMARRAGHRTTLCVPLLRDGMAIGTIMARRAEVRPFTDTQIALLEIFADQAVIAIENVRLFKELEASNREIAEKSSQIEVASQHKSEFLANMSHELRTPLNAIIGFSEVLTDRMFGELNEKQEEYLKDIYASGTHLLSLINDILDLSKIEAGRMELELTDFHLPTALDNALTLVRERAGRRSIILQTSVDARLGEVRADERKIRQVVLNLLSNAIKFTPEGGRIKVGAVPRDGSVEVSVSDTGVGIAPEDQEAVFEEFRQVGTAEKKAEGTGLGLTLCRKFIELHGGRIWVTSQVGVGSTFRFTIPVRGGDESHSA